MHLSILSFLTTVILCKSVKYIRLILEVDYRFTAPSTE